MQAQSSFSTTVRAVLATGITALIATTTPADAAPVITAVVDQAAWSGISPGNFAMSGTGFTPGNGLVHVWLIDFTFSPSTLLWFTPEVFVFPGGIVGVNGPMRFSHSDVFGDWWAPEIWIPCGRNIRMIAKDGRYDDPQAAWSNVSENLSPACPPIN